MNLISVKEAADQIGVHTRTIYRWIDAGHLPAVRFGNATIRIRQDDLDAMGQALRPTSFDLTAAPTSETEQNQ